jgi:hypothetical protein
MLPPSPACALCVPNGCALCAPRPDPTPCRGCAGDELCFAALCCDVCCCGAQVTKYRNQPSVMAALHRSQNASLVQEAMERFVECEQEVVAVEVIRR